MAGTRLRPRFAEALARLLACSPKAFLWSTAITFLVGAAGMYAFCRYVNPWGNYGTTGYSVLGDARRAKTEYIDSLEPDALPQVLVLGSSNTMRYRPATIEERLGLTAFNFGVFWGKAEDLVCIARHLVYDLGHRPRLLIVGVDTWTFAPPGDEHPIFPGVRRRLLNTPQLARHLPEVNPVAVRWARFIDAFSVQQLELSWWLVRRGTVARTTRPSMIQSDKIAADGTRLYYGGVNGDGSNVFDAVEAGQYPITRALQTIVDDGRVDELTRYSRQYNFQAFWEPRVQHMRRFLDVCRQNDVQVVFAINPVHPVFFDVLAGHTPHLRNLDTLRSLLARLEKQYPIVVGTFDASRIANFGGDPDGFYDPVHPATPNSDLIIHRLCDLIESR